MADSQVAKSKNGFALISKQSTIPPSQLPATSKVTGLDQQNITVLKTLDCSSKYPSQASILT
jgi:hypothetical protein